MSRLTELSELQGWMCYETFGQCLLKLKCLVTQSFALIYIVYYNNQIWTTNDKYPHKKHQRLVCLSYLMTKGVPLNIK